MKHRVKSAALAFGLLSVGACSDTTGPEAFEDSLTLDVAMIAADAAIDAFGDMALLFGSGAVPVHSGGSMRTHTATFFDADGNQFDAEGNPLDAQNPLTASIHLVVESTHDFSRDSWSGTGTRSRDLWITGLEGEETSRTVNGTGSSVMTRSQHTDADGTRTYDMTSTSVIVDVIHPVPRTDDAWPLSGTITQDVTINVINGPQGDVTKSRTVVITFNGTNLATMTVDGETFDVDLSTRSGRHPFRRRGR